MGKSISGDVAGIFMESYENEFVLDSKKNKCVPIFWEREFDDVYCLWQYGEEHIQDFLEYLNGCHPRIKWAIEVEKEGKLSFVDLSLCRKSFRISAGINTFSSNRPRVEQLGIVKSMLHQAHELCDEGEPLSNEIELLGNVCESL